MKFNFEYFESSGHDIRLQFAFQPSSWPRVLDWVPDKFEMMRERGEFGVLEIPAEAQTWISPQWTNNIQHKLGSRLNGWRGVKYGARQIGNFYRECNLDQI